MVDGPDVGVDVDECAGSSDVAGDVLMIPGQILKVASLKSPVMMLTV